MRLTGCIGVVALVLSATGCTQSPAAVRWDPSGNFSPDDQRHILRLAETVGFPDVEGVSSEEMVPSEERYALAASHSRWSGRKRAWATLRLCDSRSWLPCETRGGSADVIRSGPWWTSAAYVDRNETWRVADGTWFVDVRLGEGVAFDDASRIVLAIRGRALVKDLRNEDDAVIEVAGLDAGEITQISKAEGPDTGFRVAVGRYQICLLWIRLVDATVELYRDECYVS